MKLASRIRNTVNAEDQIRQALNTRLEELSYPGVPGLTPTDLYQALGRGELSDDRAVSLYRDLTAIRELLDGLAAAEDKMIRTLCANHGFVVTPDILSLI